MNVVPSSLMKRPSRGLPHTIAEHLAAAELALVAVDGRVLFDHEERWVHRTARDEVTESTGEDMPNHVVTAPDDFGANLLSERLALVALSVARGAYGSGETAMRRAVFLLTGEEDYDREQLKALVSQRSAMELDIAFLRAVADVMEALENERLDAQKKGGA